MRGHGSVVVGETPETALVACTYIEENALFQLEAEALGAVIPLSPEELHDCSTNAFGIAPRLWDFWERRVITAGLPL